MKVTADVPMPLPVDTKENDVSMFTELSWNDCEVSSNLSVFV